MGEILWRVGDVRREGVLYGEQFVKRYGCGVLLNLEVQTDCVCWSVGKGEE
jgi:hypothetical protein